MSLERLTMHRVFRMLIGVAAVYTACGQGSAATMTGPDQMPIQPGASLHVGGTIVPSSSRTGVKVAASDEPAKLAAGNPVLAPLKWNGLWVSKDGEGVLQCTAQFITPRIILTAAHCVRNQTGGWDADTKSSVFLLQYQNEAWSKRYEPLCIYVPTQWRIALQPGEDPKKPKTMTPKRYRDYTKEMIDKLQYDYAFVYLNASSITGYYNLHANEQWRDATAIGYPAAVMGGAVIQKQAGDISDTVAFSPPRYVVPNEQVLIQSDPNFTQGASGGAWVGNLSTDESSQANIVVGVNSFVNLDSPGALYSPKFNDTFVQILNYTAANCP